MNEIPQDPALRPAAAELQRHELVAEVDPQHAALLVPLLARAREYVEAKLAPAGGYEASENSGGSDEDSAGAAALVCVIVVCLTACTDGARRTHTLLPRRLWVNGAGDTLAAVI